MLGTRTLRDRSSSRDLDITRQTEKESTTKGKGKKETLMDDWSEPSLVQKPSYRDHSGGSYYGVSEHMQPLGEAPSARVKARVKPEGARKSMLGKAAGAMGLDPMETPEGTPAPTHTQVETPSQPRIVVEDEGDGDYAPKATGKKKERVTRPRAVKRHSEVTPAPGNGTSESSKPMNPPPNINKNMIYSPRKLKAVVEAAVHRAIEVGKPDLAAAVHAIHERSLYDARLTELLEAILIQEATKDQTIEFQGYVKAEKKKLKASAKESSRNVPKSTNGAQSLPLRSPSKFTSVDSETSAIPSTEKPEPTKARISWKPESTSKDSGRRRSGQSSKMSASPSKKRSGSVGSDSSLTDMTSNPDDDMDVDEPDGDVGEAGGPSSGVNSIKIKDHAAERGSLAAPNRNLKRSSAEADFQDEERDRNLASKKQKLSETVTREQPYQESNVRRPPNVTAAQLRSRRGKNGTLAPPSLSTANSTRNTSTRGSRAVSTDLDSPLSSPASSRKSTPHVYKGPTKPFTQKAKTKQSPEKKHHAGHSRMLNASGAGRESPIGDDDNEELSDNNDFCAACGGSGFLLCCDGCDRSFHFSCLDPPLNEDASELNEPWYCFICVAKRPVTSGSPEKPQRGLFAPLFSSLRKRNPSNFALPQDIRDYFEGVATDRNGSFIEAVHTKTRNRPGYDEVPDFTKTKDGKGNTLLCYSCGKSSQGLRAVIQCDYCGENWHLDCLDPPLSNPPARNLEGKKLHDWMCPLHADHELRKVDTTLLNARGIGRKVHVRKPRNAKIVETSLRRGFRNNGVIDVVEDDTDDSGSDFYDDNSLNQSVVYRLPASGIKLDFIDKVKNSRVQRLRSEHAFKRARIAANAPRQLQQANFARRSFREKQMALNLAQFANANTDLDLGSDEVENLVGTLIAEAPSEVVNDIAAAEVTAGTASSAIPPSPPASDQTDQLSAEQRKELQMLQELIRRRLDGGKT